jgi:endonuclease/exonuclease/phosphatase family metal-dependent hydrolase
MVVSRTVADDRITLRVRTWNIAHGVDVPPRDRDYAHERRKHLPQMARLMVEDEPDLILLQEVPVWAGPLLAEHTGMAVTMAPAYGAHVPFLHVPLPLAVGAALGNALPDLIRTQFEGQANALLYGADLLLVSARRALLNERHRLRGEPRIAQLARLRHRRAGREFAVANIHADHGDNRQQMERAGFLLERFARGAPAILAGDFNAGPSSPSVRALEGRGWQQEPADVRIDHIFSRGFAIDEPSTRWPATRRDLNRNGGPPVRLSDHSPVDAVLSC